MDWINKGTGARARSASKRAGSRKRNISVWQLAVLGICLTAIISWAVLTVGGTRRAQAAPEPGQGNQGKIADSALRQIQALLDEKESRTPAQQRIDSQLLYAMRQRRGERVADSVETLSVDVNVDAAGKTVVDISGRTHGPLVEEIEALGGEVISVFPLYDSMRARVPLDQLETIAESPQVRFIQPKQEAITSRYVEPHRGLQVSPGFAERASRVHSGLMTLLPQFAQPQSVVPNTGSRNSEGDATHKVNTARANFGANGAGVRIGVLSDGVDSLNVAMGSGDLPPVVTILSGQAGDGDEGTAMLELIHDLAPGAQLFFATAFGGSASFAQNIRDLRAAGCDIIVDDVFYFAESPFQDGQAPGVPSNTNGGIITQAVADVVANGASYFSSAGNSGNKNDNRSGTYQADFLDGGMIGIVPGGTVHNFGGGVQFNAVTFTTTGPCNLFWTDPLAGSANDYDLFVLNSSGSAVVSSSTNLQNGSQDPFEQAGGLGTIGNQVVVLKKTGAANRFFYLSANRGRLNMNTEGQMRGHSCAENAFGCAATPAAQFAGPPNPMGPFPGPFNATNTVELFSSDGPRRLFFNSNGSAITPGNFSSTGGLLRQKPDITAADGTTVTGAGGFPSPFFGTSAAAPHAGAIAALLKSANPSLTRTQIRNALINTAIDIEGPGVDRDSGAGIVMALEALMSIGAVAGPNFEPGTVTASESGGDSDGIIDPGESANLNVQLRNTGVANANSVNAMLSTSTPGVNIIQGNSAYPNIGFPAGLGVNVTPFRFSLNPNAPCPLRVDFLLTLTFTGGGSPRAAAFSVQTGSPPMNIVSTLDTVAPNPGPTFTATTGIQNLRLTRDGDSTLCGLSEPCPGPFGAGTRRYDAYSFTTCPSPTPYCVEVTLTTTCQGTNPALFGAAYLGSFDPNNICTNYLGDAGVSRIDGGPASFSFNVPGGATFVVVVHEVNQDLGLNCAYTLTVSGLCLPCGAVTGPLILSAERSGKKLFVNGIGFDDDAKVLLNGSQQKTANDEFQPTMRLIAKKAGKKIDPGQTVDLQVRNSNGNLSNIFRFTRPVQ
ncbi:MAG TPA: S8 family serine peptidase [Blastocatellia bacterium]|nr:S8 family serine peptidase [Blastocatellia bacterium]